MLEYKEPVEGAAELINTLLPVSKVPLDMSAQTHNKSVLLLETASHVAPLQTERRAKCIIKLT